MQTGSVLDAMWVGGYVLARTRGNPRWRRVVRHSTNRWLGFFLAVSCLLVPGRLPAQAQQPAVVIEGGTLIDGNGGAPVRDAVVVIQGNRITAVSRKGQTQYPPNAQVINADGKFILPGLWDAQISYNWYFGEVMLQYGITATVDVGNSSEVAVPHRDAVIHGKVRGPRPFTSITRLARVPEGGTGLETILTPTRAPQSVQETRDMVKTFFAAGADYLVFNDGALPMEYYQAGFEEAKRLGKPVLTRAYGPIFGPRDAAMMGSRALPHSAGLAQALMKNPLIYVPTTPGQNRNEADMWSEMDEARAKEMIQLLVEHKVALTPTFRARFAGLPRDWARFAEEDRKFFETADANLLAYFPREKIIAALAGYRTPAQTGAVAERRKLGYQNALRFHKMFVDAGGHLIPGANTGSGRVPANSLFQEFAIFSEAGATPMQIIQGATKWSAEMIDKGHELGTVEPGKIADVIIVNQDPLQNIAHLRDTSTVIFDGKVVPRGYSTNYSDTFWRDADFNYPVDALQWVTALKATAGPNAGQAPAATLPDPAESPQPGIETINPVMVTEGSPAITLTLKGFNFVRRSQVLFKGAPVPYKVVNASELQVTLYGNVLKEPGWHELVVKNPWPLNRETGLPWGNGTSNKAHLIVNYRH